jgi:hypothetical protein
MPLKIKPRPRFPSQFSAQIFRELAAALNPASLLQRAGFDPPEPWQSDVMLSGAKRLAVLCPRQSGKSTTVAAHALHHALYRPNSVVLIVSRAKRQSDLLFEKVIDIFNAIPDKPTGARVMAGRLELPNGSRIISLPGNEKTVRGLSADLVIVDEAAQVPDALFNTVVPMVAARKGRIIALSTPCGKHGFFYKACQPGSQWTLIKIKAEESKRLTSEALEEARGTFDLHWYRQEFECEFLGDSTRYFPSELIAAAFDETVEPFNEGGHT